MKSDIGAESSVVMIISNSRTTCGADGQWSHPLPSCLAPCIVPDIPHGEVSTRATPGHTTRVPRVQVVGGAAVGDKLEHGARLAVNCSENYESAADTSGRGHISCSNGTWSSVPSCVPARCKTIPAPPSNGMIVVADTQHGSVGLFQCKGDNKRIRMKLK